jgi:hypothetical protein
MSVKNAKHSGCHWHAKQMKLWIDRRGTFPWKLKNRCPWSWKHVGNFICISSGHFAAGGTRNRAVVTTFEEPLISKPTKPRHFHRNVKCVLFLSLSVCVCVCVCVSIGCTCMLPISSFKPVDPFSWNLVWTSPHWRTFHSYTAYFCTFNNNNGRHMNCQSRNNTPLVAGFWKAW